MEHLADISIAAVLIRFLLGGGAVVAAIVIAKKIGGSFGGIFAAFPAVYLAAILTIGIDANGQELISRSITISKGALIGMGINIACAIAVGYLSSRQGWKKGLLHSVFGWFFVSLLIAYLSTEI